jgi:hypothetical protein
MSTSPATSQNQSPLSREFAVKFMMSAVLVLSLAGCSMFKGREDSPADPRAGKTTLDQAMGELSMAKLDQASLVFRVAFEKSRDAWQGPGEDVVPGCKISGKEAENGLAAVKPWLERRANEEAKRAIDGPKAYQLPINVETCERDCSCELGLKILEAADLDSQSYQKVKELKRLRTRLEAKSELMTRDRAELCAEGSTWICSSEVLNALRLQNPSQKKSR